MGIRSKFPETKRPAAFRDVQDEVWNSWTWQVAEAAKRDGIPPYWPGGEPLADFWRAAKSSDRRSPYRSESELTAAIENGDFALDGDKDVVGFDLFAPHRFLPQRITNPFVELLKNYDQVFIGTQFNHPSECTREAFDACSRLADAGFILNNRMTLMKGVNDDAESVKLLNHRLLMMRVRPYCIQKLDFSDDSLTELRKFECDDSTGIQILEALRGWTSGLAVPHYVIRGTKDRLQVPNYVVSFENGTYRFRNYKNNEYIYRDS